MITKNFTEHELAGHGENWNLIPSEHSTNLIYIAENILQPARDLDPNHPIFISSGYRSKAHNDAVHGAKSSQHILGKAVDIYKPNMTGLQLFEFILKNFHDKIGGIGLYSNEGLLGKFIHFDIRPKINGAITTWYCNSAGVYLSPTSTMIKIFNKLNLRFVG